MLYECLRPLLFRLEPELAHEVSLHALAALSRLGAANPLKQRLPDAPVKAMGLTFPNPVGLAAGLDKNGQCVDGFGDLGFGFIEVGTVTPLPQPGNPKPRLFRLVEHEALINRMGFNNLGVDRLLGNIAHRRFRGPLGINIGKNLSTSLENAQDDYRIALRKVYTHADYIALNVSSPNTPGLRGLQSGDALRVLLSAVVDERARLSDETGRQVPLAVKLAPDVDDGQLPFTLDILLRFGIDAVIATNTTLSRNNVETSRHAGETGGLSGRPLFERSTQIVAQISGHVSGALPVIASGGIFNAEDAMAKFLAGANLVQVYTGFIYRGPALIAEVISRYASGFSAIRSL
ncbi:quinone-dependent dihydroorotate dehydrogenase [Candidatus Methylospira mobilis]|uniref:Dihydroorotate dehydrogenase (quinone) n=1 Tax=Candidatus Methylospira mobilis TaxID=1808979 RepID=A0A5Q0BQ78_9GAMM|nr:quinone-dependent dihydroorotate dehydrogenase [Candidatus Methylospira mobilis]QFY44237.1 quinone-dependent dihydroorotate dehydrogenase [Candidatus Methylospira mobilis]WNV06336.1 quinone-dependent dihydroorotate dehydrogenase [Candidatus Methylospira mobilis]